jgi:hypothetical protein
MGKLEIHDKFSLECRTWENGNLRQNFHKSFELFTSWIENNLLYQYTEFVFVEFGTKGDITMICTYIRRQVRTWVLGGSS